MKKTLPLLLSLSLAISIQSIAQNFEGKITMKMEVKDLPPDMESMKSMFENTITTYTKGSLVRTETTSPLTGTMFVIMDQDKKEVVMCMDMMGTKKAIVSSMEDYQKQNGVDGTAKDFKCTETNDTKDVAGFKCHKSKCTVTTADDQKMEMEIWFSKEIQNINTQLPEVTGMPLDYSVQVNQFTMHFFATDVSRQKVDDSMFVVPADYVITTQEEMQKQLGLPGK